MNRHLLIGLAAGLVVGIFIGYQAGSSSQPERPAAYGVPQGPAAQQPAAGDVFQGRIATNLETVARDPKNVKAWTQLGNDYYDTRQQQKAIDAYTRALELDPKNPDIITDQGVMYRDLRQYDKAIANFQKANQIAPKHVQSLYNLGVVYTDLKQLDKAAAAWKKVIEIAPDSSQAAQARTALVEVKQN